ncbi:hypothetical protein BHM03_00039174 [Ensete ventricosum]|nr:hypothetical protein BHM03_00039174 [Ensete ventricosum]
MRHISSSASSSLYHASVATAAKSISLVRSMAQLSFSPCFHSPHLVEPPCWNQAPRGLWHPYISLLSVGVEQSRRRSYPPPLPPALPSHPAVASPLPSAADPQHPSTSSSSSHRRRPWCFFCSGAASKSTTVSSSDSSLATSPFTRKSLLQPQGGAA